MSVCARPLKTLIAQRDIILPSLPPLVTVTQCPGIISQTEAMNSKKRGIGIIGEKEEQEKEQREEKYIIMMRAGPQSAQATRLIPAQVIQSGLQEQRPHISHAARGVLPSRICG